MTAYINREPIAESVADVNEGIVSVRTRIVGKSAVVDITEESPALARPASKTVIVGLVRGAARAHVSRPKAVGAPINDTEIVRETYSVDPATGYRTVNATRIRTATFVVGAR